MVRIAHALEPAYLAGFSVFVSCCGGILLLTMPNRSSIMFTINRMPLAKRAQILALLVEGNGLRATSRLADCSINTVTKLLVDAGTACAEYQDAALRNLSCKQIQCDEIWAFCYSKARNVPEQFKGLPGYGDIWTWTALCADTELMVSWLVGDRTAETAADFTHDLASRLTQRIQLSTDGNRMYVNAVESAFAGDIDYAMLVKHYGEPNGNLSRRYSPSRYTGSTRIRVNGKPDEDKVNTSYVERQNLTMRMGMRRFTRLTNGFSKKAENHAHAVALHFMHYNFGRIHKTLRVTPAMEAGISDHVWSLEEVAKLAI